MTSPPSDGPEVPSDRPAHLTDGTARRCLVIVPAWNEEGSIAAVVREVRGVSADYDVLVVDDGSTDATAALADRAGATVLRLPYNLGVGGAMRLGYRYAQRRGYPVAVQVDADGQHDPAYIPALLERLADADLVIGSRFAGTGDYRVRGPRQWAMKLLSVVLSRMAHTALTDTTSGFRAANRQTIELFALWYPTEYLGDTVETTVRVLRKGGRVRQVPVQMRARTTGRPSHSPVRALVYLGRALLALLLSLVRR